MLSSFVCYKKTIMQNASRPDLAKALWDKESIVWVDLEAPDEFESESLVELFNFHPLAVEDCINDSSEPKIDDYEDYLFLVVHAASFDSGNGLNTIELDIFVSKNYVVTFHKEAIPSIAQIKELVIRKPALMCEGTDMLVHAILDRLVDRYLPVLTEHDRRIDEIEDQVFEETSETILQKILKVQKDILLLKRIMGPQRDTMSHLSRTVQSFVRPKNLIYFRDIYDHLFQFYQMAEEMDGLLKGIIQIYFSHASNQLNQAIKTMTVLATIALPSIVIASIYGMNFRHMPELAWPYGYYFSLGLMAASSAVLLIWMKVKKWF